MKLKYNLLRCLAVVVSIACLQTQAYSDVLAEQDRVVIPLKARAFRLEDVRLLDGPFKSAMELDRQYLLSLDVDRLLHNFRVNAALPSSAEPQGGWEEPKCELRGHFVGHYLSACAMMYASTGDKQLKQKGNAVVSGLDEPLFAALKLQVVLANINKHTLAVKARRVRVRRLHGK